MKKLSILLCIALLVTGLAACGGGYGSSANYRTVIETARPAELNELETFAVVTGPLTEEEAAAESDMDKMRRENVFGEFNDFVEDDMERYAISISNIIVQAYGVAVILPKQGREQAVLDQVNAYVEANRKAQENYLQDQYEIAKAAIVRTAKTGEVIMVMCENSAEIADAIEAALKG